MKREAFVTDEFYHIFNRGVDKRVIFNDEADKARFFKSMVAFNTREPVGSLYELAFAIKLGRRRAKEERLVDIVCYCLNPNHYHFILRQRVDGGISEYTRRLGIGYTSAFNIKYKRSGVLFQGKSKSVHIISNEQLLYVSAYVNLNWQVHRLGRFGDRISKSSWEEYVKGGEGICDKKIILSQFKSAREYKDFAEDALVSILEKKQLNKEFKTMLLE